jgi:hypothetical protein
VNSGTPRMRSTFSFRPSRTMRVYGLASPMQSDRPRPS